MVQQRAWYLFLLLEGGCLLDLHHAWLIPNHNDWHSKCSFGPSRRRMRPTLLLLDASTTRWNVVARQNLTDIHPFPIQRRRRIRTHQEDQLVSSSSSSSSSSKVEVTIVTTTATTTKTKTTTGDWRSFSAEERAIQQVSAIMDLYNMTDAGVSDLIVSKALEGLINRLCRDQRINGQLLEQVEELVWRLDDLHVLPTPSCVESLWMMQQQHCQQHQQDEKPSKQIGRSVRFLMNWILWANDYQTSNIPKPPIEYVQRIFAMARETNVTMSFRMWDLYRYLHATEPESLPRNFYTLILDILSYSPAPMKCRQFYVLQDLQRRYQATGDDIWAPSVNELESCLMAAARNGQAMEATWAFRALRTRQSKTQLHVYLKLWFQGISKSPEPGAARYMEQFLLSSQEDLNRSTDSDSSDLYQLMSHRYYYNMVLQKWATTRTPGSGMRAQALFDAMVKSYRKSENENLRPNEESVHHVVMAYLREVDSSLQHLLDAHRFLRQALQQLGSLRDPSSSRQWRTFDNLLEAYSKFHDESMAIAAADRLFQLFLVHHRDGDVTEEPDPFHLSHVLKLWNKAPSPEGAEKSLEFFRLMDSLYDQGKIASRPDAFNIRQLLGTLAQSEIPGQGEYAELLLDRVLEDASTPDSFDSFVKGHMFWCVVKCYCNDRTADGYIRGRKVLQRLENIHFENPLSVRLTGASYKILVHGWALLGGEGAGEQAQSILEDLEQLHARGNKHAKLSWDIYLDAIKAWTKDPSSHAIQKVDQLYQRWTELTSDSERHPSVDMAVAVAHATCPDGSLERSERLMTELNTNFESGDDDSRVSSLAWHSLLDKLSKNAPPQSCLPRALALFERMQRQDRLGRPVADLRSWAYESLMRSWSRSGESNAVAEMESLYAEVMEMYQNGNLQMQPSIILIDLLLETYNDLESQDKAVSDKALRLVQDAQNHFKNGNAAMKPGRSTIWLILTILGRSECSDDYQDAIYEILQWRESV